MNTADEIALAEEEVEGNYTYFKQMQPEWKVDHLSEFALIHKKGLVGFFESESDAIQVGVKDYGMGHFSVQSVQGAPVSVV